MNHLQKITDKIFPDFPEFRPLLEKWRKAGDKLVFTNGCFDLLHRGHVEYLAKAASKGDRLIVGLNSDASVTRLKGLSRPLIDGESRAVMLAALASVDAVVLFEEDTPDRLVKEVLPDLLVKGSDWELHKIVGADTVLARGGKVETIELSPGFSTSEMIEKIRNLTP